MPGPIFLQASKTITKDEQLSAKLATQLAGHSSLRYLSATPSSQLKSDWLHLWVQRKLMSSLLVHSTEERNCNTLT
jgi:hypothetical protein